MLTIVAFMASCLTGWAAEPIRIDSRLELLVDDYLIENMTGMRCVLHEPTKREIAVDHDAPWEGNNCCFHTVFRDGSHYRMYYLSGENPMHAGEKLHRDVIAYAVSSDGIHWLKPKLGLIEFNGSKQNNIIWDVPGTHSFAAFKDANPACKPDERYKAVAQSEIDQKKGASLVAMKSRDGIHWFRWGDKPIMTRAPFDSQNLVFWDAVRGEYRAYFREHRNGLRDIRTATSRDFGNWPAAKDASDWTAREWLQYPGSPAEELYTNQIAPYYRAPHIFLGFPTRYVDRGWNDSFNTMPDLEMRKGRAAICPRYGAAVTDGLFMSSRDGVTFKRWGEAFLRPGPQELGQWIYGDQYQNWGIVETKSDIPGTPNELSMYATEGQWRGKSCRLRRYTIRIDGFVSLQAPLSGGECLTKLLSFSGRKLVINFATSAAGSVRIEIQDANGKPIPGFALAECPEIFGDSLERTVGWKGGCDVSTLAGQPVRLRFQLKDADMYSLRFK